MARNSNRTARPADSPRMPALLGPEWASDFARQQAAVATEGTCALFRGFEAMRAIQQKAAQEATARHAAIGEQLRKPCTPLELMTLQGELLRFDMEAATRYWQQLAGVAMETTTELMACGAHLVDTEDVFAAVTPRFLHS